MSKHEGDKCGINKISDQYVKSTKEKSVEDYNYISRKFQNGHNSCKIHPQLTVLNLDLWSTTRKSSTKFQLNMSKHEGDKSGKVQ